MQWTNTIDTVVKVETAQAKGQWQIGDAIQKDFRASARPKGEIPRGVFMECGARLAKMGYDNYSPNHLANLHRTAIAFDAQDRDPEHSWYVHAQAGTPDNLKKLLIALRKFKKPITGDNVRDLRVLWAEEAREERKKASDAAAKKKKAARDRKVKATEAILAAKGAEEKAKAQAERDDAIREIEELTATIKANSGAPALNTDLNVDVEDVSSLRRWAVYFRIELHLSKIEKEANDALKEIEEVANMLSERERNAVDEGCTKILALIGKIKGVAKPGFKAIQGGKA